MLVKSCGTVFQITLHLLYHSHCLGKDLKRINFGSRIRTLLCSLFVVLLAMMVLAVVYLSNCSLTHLATILHTNHTCRYSSAARHHRPLAGIHCAYPHRDGQAELAWVAGHIP